MRECSNVDVRDLLPALLHERLGAGERARAEAHVAGCAACAAELVLLREVRAADALGGPRLDVDAIAAAVRAATAGVGVAGALPALRVVDGGAPRARRSLRAQRSRPQWGSTPGWLRAAAAVAVVAIGAGGFLAGRDDATSQRTVAIAPSTPDSRPPISEPAAGTADPPSGSPAEPVQLAAATPRHALGASFGDLSDDEVRAVVAAIDADDDVLLVGDPGTDVPVLFDDESDR